MNDITEIEGQILPPDAGSDIENPELAYQYEDLEMGSGQGIYPDVIDCHNTECQNQYEDPRTVNCCTVFGLDHTRRNSTLSNISYALFGKDISLDLAIPAFPSIEHSGWSMTGALQLFKNNGLIHGYAIIGNDDYSVAQALYSGRAIYTGTNKVDWVKTAQNNATAVYGTKNNTGHVFCIDKIDFPNEFVGVHDSAGPAGWNNSGHFRIPFDVFFNHCYSKVILLDANESANLQEITDNKMIQKAIDVGITNGDNLDNPITRQEAAVMIVRAMDGQDIPFEEADQIAIDRRIYNGQGKEDAAERGHTMLMVASMLGIRDHDNDQLTYARLLNAGITSGKNPGQLITRRDAILLITRGYIVKNK